LVGWLVGWLLASLLAFMHARVPRCRGEYSIGTPSI